MLADFLLGQTTFGPSHSLALTLGKSEIWHVNSLVFVVIIVVVAIKLK